MKQRSPILAWGVIVFAVITLAGCAGGKKAAKIYLFPEYALSDPAAQTQTKSSVAIAVTPLGPSRMYDFPELFSFRKEDVAEEIVGEIAFGNYFQKDFEGKWWCYTFGTGEENVAAFKVEIKNGTDHILRMKDSRIYIEVEDQDPIAAVTKLGNPTLIPVTDPNSPWKVVPASAAEGDESLIHWVTYWEKEAERTRKKQKLFDSQYRIPVGLRSQVIAQNRQAYKLVADTDAEILPGKSLRGILLFPVVVSFETATVSFYDIHTQADAAGNPTEKQTFTFPIRLERVQMQWDAEKEKRWQKVSMGS